MKTKQNGFTLIELLVVVAIIGLLAAILVPVASKAQKSSLKRRAELEMNSIKMAITQFYEDHRYMPVGDPTDKKAPRVGKDVWIDSNEKDQEMVMRWLTGENPLNKVYLQIPEKSRPDSGAMTFLDPWKQFYRIGMDRNLDGSLMLNAAAGGNTPLQDRVAVYSLGDPREKNTVSLRTYELPE